MKPIRILAIDPGTEWTGWAALEFDALDGLRRVLDSGLIKLKLTRPLLRRAQEVIRVLEEVVSTWDCTRVVTEAPFLGRNARGTLTLARFIGMLEFGLGDIQQLWTDEGIPMWMRTEWAKVQLGNAKYGDDVSIARARSDWGVEVPRVDQADAIHIGGYWIYLQEHPEETPVTKKTRKKGLTRQRSKAKVSARVPRARQSKLKP